MPSKFPLLTVPQLVATAAAAGEAVRTLPLAGATLTHAVLSRPVVRHEHPDLCLTVHLATPGLVAADVGEGATAEVAVAAGDAFLWQPGAPRHLHWPDGRVEFVGVHFPAAYLREVAHELTDGRVPEFAGRAAFRDPFLTAAALALREEFTTAARGPLFLQSQLAAVASHLIARYATPAPCGRAPGGLPSAALARVLAYVRDHLAEAITLGDLARVARMSPFHFARLFRASTGEPPHRYLVARRVERARELLLLRPSFSVAEVAAACGFADSSHLARHFRRLVGVSPSAFRGGAATGQDRPDP